MFSATSRWSSGEFSPWPGARPSLAIVSETEAAVAAPFASWRRMSSWNGNMLGPILLMVLALRFAKTLAGNRAWCVHHRGFSDRHAPIPSTLSPPRLATRHGRGGPLRSRQSSGGSPLTDSNHWPLRMVEPVAVGLGGAGYSRESGQHRAPERCVDRPSELPSSPPRPTRQTRRTGLAPSRRGGRDSNDPPDIHRRHGPRQVRREDRWINPDRPPLHRRLGRPATANASNTRAHSSSSRLRVGRLPQRTGVPPPLG